MNQMNLVKESKIYHLKMDESCGVVLNKIPSYKSSLRFNIPTLDLNGDDIEYVTVSIPYATIPCTFYNIDIFNNQLDILFNDSIQSFVFPSGNFNEKTFISEFQLLLGNGFILSTNYITAKYTLTNPTYSFVLLPTSTIKNIIGFENSVSSNLVGLSNTVEMPDVFEFSQISRVHIKTTDFFTNDIQVGNSQLEYPNYNDVLLSIVNDGKINSRIIYKNDFSNEQEIKNSVVNSFSIRITDDNNHALNFNNVAATFSLRFDIYRVPKFKNRTKIRDLVNQLSTYIN